MGHLSGPPLIGAITSACSAGFLLFGYDQGVMSGVVISPSWLSAMGHPSPWVIGTLTAVYDIGAIIGAILAAFTSDSLGRKRTLLLGAFLVCISGLAMGFSRDRVQFGASRTAVGVGIGYITSVCPVYQSEISAHKQRGWQVCCQLTTMLVGLALAYWINYGFYFYQGDAQWRVPLWIQCVFAVYILVLTPFLPDTPRWLFSHGSDAAAGKEVLARLRGKPQDHQEVQQEAEQIQLAIDRETKANNGHTPGWGDLFKPNGVSADKRFYLAIGIQFMQQMTGINIVTYYAPTLYKTGLGMSEEKALLLGGYTQLWYILASLVTWYTIDRVGRRKLFISMALGMAVVLVGEGLATKADSHMGAIIAVVCLFLFEGCFSWGWMACVWIYPPEILPLSIRAKGSALAAAADFIGNWIVVEVTPVGIATMGWTFYLVWATFNLVNAGIVWLFYPETGGLQLEAVDHVFTEEIADALTAGADESLFQRLQWARVRIAAEAVKESRRRTRSDRRNNNTDDAEPLLGRSGRGDDYTNL
ncbi:general substrate transporter [Podospora australis]|uniref:General substrate transporter n=1 Tax=Podospora australis TaxID=1536484 RepID=A0AAN6WPI8_9PEZI|nr:general substrate transporter [Podospora australis]